MARAPQANSNPRVLKLIELETAGRIKPEHQQELDTYRAQGLAPKGAATTEGERKASAFITRALGANQSYEGLDVGPRSLVGQAVADTSPNLLNSLPGFIGNSAERQVADTNQDEFIAASLRQDSGAAIPPEEMERQRRIYFPMPGDGEEVIKAKAAARRRAIEGLVNSAGAGLDPTLRAKYPEYFGGAAADDASKVRRNVSEEGLSALTDSEDEPGLDIVVSDDSPATPEEAAALARRNGDRNTRAQLMTGIMGNNAAMLQGATLGFSDEIAGVGGAIGNVLTGGTAPEGYARSRDAERYRLDEQRRAAPVSSAVAELGGGLLLPSFGATGAGQLARLGAAYGGAYGVGSSDGGLGERLASGASGAAVGAGVGYGLGRLGQMAANRFGNRPPPPATGAQDLIQAARTAGLVDEAGRPLVLPADVGGPMTRRMTAGVGQTPFGTGPIVQAAERAQGAAGARLGEIAQAEGAPLRQEQLGEAAQNAAQDYIDSTGQAAGRAYNRARAMARGDGTRMVRADRALQNIDEQISSLAETSNTDAPLISGLERLRADIANGDSATPLSIDAIRRLRTSTRAEARSEGLRNTDYNRRAQTIIDDLSEDIASQLSPRSAAAFREADQAYAERLNVIDDVMEEVIGSAGDRSAEAVAKRLVSMGRGDSARLSRFLNAVNPEEAGIVRGSLIQEIGRSTPGQQTAAGDAFSFSTFLSNWDQMPERTRNLLFRGESREIVDALAVVAERARATSRYANTSGTAGASNASALVSESGRALSIGAAISSLGGTVVLENLTGRLLGSRRFAQWLGRAPRDPAERGAWVRRLGVIAAREPAIANDIIPLQQALSQLPARAAASEQTGQNPQE